MRLWSLRVDRECEVSLCVTKMKAERFFSFLLCLLFSFFLIHSPFSLLHKTQEKGSQITHPLTHPLSHPLTQRGMDRKKKKKKQKKKKFLYVNLQRCSTFGVEKEHDKINLVLNMSNKKEREKEKERIAKWKKTVRRTTKWAPHTR